MKILISNAYSWKNKGDAAILLAMISDLKNQFRGLDLSLSTHDLDDFGRYEVNNYDMNIEKYVYNFNDNKILKLLKIFKFLFLVIINHFFSKNEFNIGFDKRIRKKILSYKKFDAVFACGGGYIYTTNAFGIFSRYVFCFDFYLAKIFKKPYILYNQSVGPFHNRLHEKIMHPFFKNAKMIICREELTFQRLENWGIKNKILKADVAFKLDVIDNDVLDKKGFDLNKYNIGITVRKWKTGALQRKYELGIANFAEKMIREHNAVFYFIPQVVFSELSDDDRVCAKSVKELISEEYHDSFVIIEDDLSPSELKYIISKMNLFTGTRMHSNIFSLSMKKPTIAIAYEPKTTGIMKLIRIEKYVINFEDVSEDKLYQLFRNIEIDNEYMAKLEGFLENLNERTYMDLNSLLQN